MDWLTRRASDAHRTQRQPPNYLDPKRRPWAQRLVNDEVIDDSIDLNNEAAQRTTTQHGTLNPSDARQVDST
jgi:hypothetical protein